MVVLRGNRAVWKGPFFQPFKLPALTTNSTGTPGAAAAAAAAAAANTTSAAVAAQKARRMNPRHPNARNQQSTVQEDAMQLRTKARNCTILPSFVGHTFYVHNGKQFLPVRVSEEMIGHRLGEFSFTKKPAIYRADNKK